MSSFDNALSNSSFNRVDSLITIPICRNMESDNHDSEKPTALHYLATSNNKRLLDFLTCSCREKLPRWILNVEYTTQHEAIGADLGIALRGNIGRGAFGDVYWVSSLPASLLKGG